MKRRRVGDGSDRGGGGGSGVRRGGSFAAGSRV